MEDMSFIALHGRDHVVVFELKQADRAVELVRSPTYSFCLFDISEAVCVELVEGVLCHVAP